MRVHGSLNVKADFWDKMYTNTCGGVSVYSER